MSETNSRHFLYWFDILRLLVRFELNNRTNEDKNMKNVRFSFFNIV